MPTKPVSEILNRELDPGLASVLDRRSALIQETADFGTYVLDWCFREAGGSDGTLAPIYLLRQTLEILDSISILVRASSIDPCFILLRGLLEVFLSSEYILKDDTENRGGAFVYVCHFLDAIEWNKKLDDSTVQGRQFKSAMAHDRMNSDLQFERPQKGKVEQEEERLRKSDYYSKHVEEYKRTKQRLNRKPYWYSLYDGPRNIPALAEEVELSAFYEILYRLWSSSVHGTNLMKRILVEDGSISILPLRTADENSDVTHNAISIAFFCFLSFLKHYRPDKEGELLEWYVREIRDGFLEM